jgi:hypothetical protein
MVTLIFGKLSRAILLGNLNVPGFNRYSGLLPTNDFKIRDTD